MPVVIDAAVNVSCCLIFLGGVVLCGCVMTVLFVGDVGLVGLCWCRWCCCLQSFLAGVAC